MQLKPLKLAGTYAITLNPISDERGYFVTTYLEDRFAACGIARDWVQENQSLSRQQGVLRGLHFQKPPHAQAKLIRVLSGAVWDVFVDIRSGSPTYGQWGSIELDADSHTMVYIPEGFAHGFYTLTDDVLLTYKVNAYYAPDHEGGIRWDDPALGITWPGTARILSEKDARLPAFDQLADVF
ncbi:MAG: dTDP-4-dehydrorhamnose 3,5-epimerase [Chloroflexi bacterium]|nr:dTDP-4-dehydrorhamnose 3,5-epimerase [Chloroflexota bacterium]